jgi:SulP family sulfate permease
VSLDAHRVWAFLFRHPKADLKPTKTSVILSSARNGKYIFYLEGGNTMTQQNQTRRTGWAQLVQPDQLLPTLATGFVTGSLTVTVSIALAALIFSGDLSAHISAGIGLMLFGTIVLSCLSALTSSFQNLIAAVQDSPAAILALIAAGIAAEMPTPASSDETFYTVVAAISLAALITGLSFWLLGQFKLGNLIRFIPYPVIGGFLAGTGGLLARGAISVMADVSFEITDPSPILKSDVLVKWLPGLVFALVLMVLLRRYKSPLIVPGMLVIGILVFYIVLGLAHTSTDEATADGWLLDALPGSGGGLWEPWSLAHLKQIDWGVVIGQSGNLAAIILVSVIGLLLNASGLELITEQNVDLNRELKAIGFSNLVSGLGGGGVGFHALSYSALAHKMGARNRLVGIFLAVLCGIVLIVGGSLLSYLPTLVIGGLLLFLGLDLLIEWVYDAWAKLPKTEYLVVILILVVINTIGFLEGVGLGLALAVLLFVISYSRTNVVRYELSGVTYRSNVLRPSLYQQLLREKGDWIYILKLQGFVFFGTANKLLDQVRQRVNDPQKLTPHAIVLDFRLVSGLDSSAVFSFIKMKQLAQARQIVLMFTHLSPNIQHQLEDKVLQAEPDPIWRVFPDLDHGIEWCEDQTISVFEGVGLAAKSKSFPEQLRALSTGGDGMMKYLEKESVEAGYFLMHQGDDPKGLYFIETGQVTVQLELDNKTVVRLRRMNAGTIVGELGVYLNRSATASVVTNCPSTLYRLSPAAMKQMEVQEPELAAAFHRYMAYFLAERITQTTETLEALID